MHPDERFTECVNRGKAVMATVQIVIPMKGGVNSEGTNSRRENSLDFVRELKELVDTKVSKHGGYTKWRNGVE